MTMQPGGDVFTLQRPTADPLPLLVSVPHAGTGIPDAMAGALTPEAARLPDTDWFLDRLYDFVPAMGGTLLCARLSRYVVDLNRPADGSPLYPGRDETGLVPVSTFHGDPIYRDGAAPDGAAIAARRQRYWQPYHDALHAELDRLKARFGFACLWDGHSIRSEVPRFFAGTLRDLLLGSADGITCAPAREAAVARALTTAGYGVRRNDTFKGGFITRSCGAPKRGIHAIQLEMPWAAYMDEQPPWRFEPERAALLRAGIEAAVLAFVQAN